MNTRACQQNVGQAHPLAAPNTPGPAITPVEIQPQLSGMKVRQYKYLCAVSDLATAPGPGLIVCKAPRLAVLFGILTRDLDA
jgi:hypothetical protein